MCTDGSFGRSSKRKEQERVERVKQGRRMSYQGQHCGQQGINPRVSWEPCICQLGLSPCRKEAEASVYWLPYPPGFRLWPGVLTLPSPVCASIPSGHPQHRNQGREQVQGGHHKGYLRHTDHPSKLCLKMKVGHEAVAQRAGVPMPSTEPGSPESHQQWWWWWVSKS